MYIWFISKNHITINDLTEIYNFTIKEELCRCIEGYIGFNNANSYKYIFVSSMAGSTIIPVSILNFLGMIPISHSRYIDVSYNCSIFLEIHIDGILIHSNISNTWDRSYVYVYGLR